MFKATAHTRNVAQLEMSSHTHTPHTPHTTLMHTHHTHTHSHTHTHHTPHSRTHTTHHTHAHTPHTHTLTHTHTHSHTGRKNRETRDGLAGQGYQCRPLEITSHDQNGMWNKNLKRYMYNS